MKKETKQHGFSGKVVKKIFAEGSKSEHEAVFLETKEGAFRLRRQGGNPFRDPVLEKLEAKTIRCSGTLRNNTLFIDEWQENEQ